MSYSSILGADRAPLQPSGRGADLLGPSDNSDSGSDAMGTTESHEDSDAQGTGERGAVEGDEVREGADIAPDRIVNADEAGLGGGADEADEAAGQADDDDALNVERRAEASFGKGYPAVDVDAREYTDLDADDAIETDADAEADFTSDPARGANQRR